MIFFIKKIGWGIYTLMWLQQSGQDGCLLSPLLHLIYDEAMITEATDNMNYETGISLWLFN